VGACPLAAAVIPRSGRHPPSGRPPDPRRGGGGPPLRL